MQGNSNSSQKGKKLLNLARNFRTANDSNTTIRPERALAIICKELEMTGKDICALIEVRRQGSGNVKERSQPESHSMVHVILT